MEILDLPRPAERLGVHDRKPARIRTRVFQLSHWSSGIGVEDIAFQLGTCQRGRCYVSQHVMYIANSLGL